MEKEYKFSVIIPIFNVEDYLAEAIDSIINQSFGFDGNVQLILVNDGSTDRSAEICKRYLERYPDNIVYVEKKNGGVSSARNEGMKYIKGEYVNFLDGDDCWDLKALEITDTFFRNHPDVDMVSGKFIMFERFDDMPHHLNYKYVKDKIIDIQKDYAYPEMSISHTFVRAKVLNDRKFDEKICISEDLLFVNLLLMDIGKYGVSSELEYRYRKRISKSSAIDNSSLKVEYYNETVELVYNRIIKESIKRYGKVLQFFQYLLAADLQWRMTKPLPDFLSDEQKKSYTNNILEILIHIEDEMIFKQKIKFEEKLYMIKAKQFALGSDILSPEQNRRMTKYVRPWFRILQIYDNKIHIEGKAVEKNINKDYILIFKNEKGEKIEAEYRMANYLTTRGFLEDISLQGYSFSFDLPLYEGAKYSFYLRTPNGSKKLNLQYGYFSRLKSIENAFVVAGEHIIKSIDRQIRVYKNRLKTRVASTIRFNKTLKNRNKKELIRFRRNVIRVRKKHKPIWIISDRTDLANDNGEALFRYLMDSDAKDYYDIYFLIDENSPDYERITRIGNVIKYGSLEHKVMVAASALVISSAGENWVFNPFGGDYQYLIDIIDTKYVFLQHGITKDDLSGWLNKINKNIRLFICAAKKEWESISELNYGYDQSIVKLTGFARHDRLENDSQRIVAIIPTWRSDLAEDLIDGTSSREYSATFKESDYFRFYNNLINDERILSEMKKYGYKGMFCLHPAFKEQEVDFLSNDTISVHAGSISYSELFSKSALMITDYSSVAMDFAYLRKPIIYAQFDRDDFYKQQTYNEGYFNYEKDGFGPVCYDYESTVNAIKSKLADGCKEDSKYLERTNEFFAFSDKNNCKRIYEELIKL